MAKTAKATTWQLQTAKAQFSELFRRALTEGPQRVTRRGKEAVVVLRAEEFEEAARRQGNLAEFFLSSPLRNADLRIERSRKPGRRVEL
jgi:prevent-host-death family protein